MKVLYYRSGLTNGVVMEIENTLEAMQKLVKGYIEYVQSEYKTFTVVNEEGRLIGMAPNRAYAGPFFIVGWDMTEDDEMIETDISEEAIRYFKNKYDEA